MGDANHDGIFDSSDLVQIMSAGKYETGELASWEEGDWNGDLDFDTTDLVVAFQGGGFEAGPKEDALNAVPEPSASLLIVIAVVAFLLKRKKIGHTCWMIDA